MVKNLVVKNSGTADDASDLFQEVLIIIYEKVRDNKLRLSCSMKTFIYSVARNQWLKKLKTQKQFTSIKNFEIYIAIEEEDEYLPAIELSDLMKEIGEACRKLLILFYYKKKSMEEISRELNYSNADSVKNQKYKCIQRLRKMIADKK
jgi:RNA polymerase sigma factor (sigma-70 family)